MAKPTERALKRKPMAVVLLECERGKVPDVPPEGRDFEWFETTDGMKKFYDQNKDFMEEDAANYDDLSYVLVEITDTADMKVGRVAGFPAKDEKVKKWVASIKKDISLVFTPLIPVSETDKKKVKPRRKNAAADVIKDEDKGTSPAEEKKIGLKARLAAKQAAGKKSETGDKKPPAKKPAAKKAAPKKADVAIEPEPDLEPEPVGS